MLKKTRERSFVMRLNKYEMYNLELLAEFEGRTKSGYLRWQLIYLYTKRFQDDLIFRERVLENIDPEVREEYTNQLLAAPLKMWLSS